MLQVGAYPLVIALRIVIAKMRTHSYAYVSEKVAHRVQGVPGVLVTGVCIGAFEHGP